MEFGGFRLRECRLQEAKARDTQFFDLKTRQPKWFFSISGLVDTMRQARKQSAVARDNPPTKLTWYFMQPIPHEYFAGRFVDEDLSIECVFYP
ncbi:Tox-REase-5 domain-containing protein [Trinickia dinghuensis]|uniref:Tox-REase-5 domain-containing protein n=1 Tax=Trinickia dinghuensis TaxID=2291023 RepID=A0A3D8JRF0_9BURK|nr:hypothetical protein DWV00_28340 [Trinickia dinghuensis]